VDKEPKATKPVVEADDDDALAGKGAAVVPRNRRPAADKAAAVNPDDHWQLSVWLDIGGPPHIHEQAIFGWRGLDLFHVARRLRAIRAKRGRLAYATPGRHWLRRAPAQVPDRRRGIRDTLEREHAVRHCSLDHAAVDRGGRIHCITQLALGFCRRVARLGEHDVEVGKHVAEVESHDVGADNGRAAFKRSRKNHVTQAAGVAFVPVAEVFSPRLRNHTIHYRPHRVDLVLVDGVAHAGVQAHVDRAAEAAGRSPRNG